MKRVDGRMQNTSAKIKSLKRTRDRFLIGAFTALRISDFNRLDTIHFDNGFLKITTKKTYKYQAAQIAFFRCNKFRHKSKK